MTRKELEAHGFEVEVECIPEDESPEGCFASGDDAADAEQVRCILDELKAGNEWAWCYVEVRVTFDGLTGKSGLGGCCYAHRADFEEHGLPDMLIEALEDLQGRARAVAKALKAVSR